VAHQIGFARSKNIMATPKQIEANRRNALKSTGPRTPQGKAAVRLNSLRHGLRARTVVLPGEDQQEFQRLRDHLEARWQPLSPSEQLYVERMAVAQWKLNRIEAAEPRMYSEALAASKHVPLLVHLWEEQCHLERSYAKAQIELKRIQQSSPAPPSATAIMENNA
jgi:hypothetical protein